MDVPAVRERAVNLLIIRKVLDKRLEKAVVTQAKYYFKHLVHQYNVGNLVCINSKHIDLTCLTKKLDWKFYRLYKVIKRIDKIVYRLDLPASMKIHNAFHVLLLKAYNFEKNGK